MNDEAYPVYSALYKEPLDQPLAFAEASVTDIPQVDGSCLKPGTDAERQMTESFEAANRQTHRWEKKFSIAQGYRVLSNNEVAIARQCKLEKDVSSQQCKPYADLRTIRLLGVPGFDQAHSRALVSVIKSCGKLCGSGGIFGGRDIRFDVRPLRGNDGREAGIVNNALRPFLVGMNVNDGRTRISPVRNRHFRKVRIRNKEQRKQCSANA